jgi:hypothetical protein
MRKLALVMAMMVFGAASLEAQESKCYTRPGYEPPEEIMMDRSIMVALFTAPEMMQRDRLKTLVRSQLGKCIARTLLVRMYIGGMDGTTHVVGRDALRLYDMYFPVEQQGLVDVWLDSASCVDRDTHAIVEGEFGGYEPNSLLRDANVVIRKPRIYAIENGNSEEYYREDLWGKPEVQAEVRAKCEAKDGSS